MMSIHPVVLQLAVIEPATTHYYQPMWTLVGGGLKTLDQSARPVANSQWPVDKSPQEVARCQISPIGGQLPNLPSRWPDVKSLQ